MTNQAIRAVRRLSQAGQAHRIPPEVVIHSQLGPDERTRIEPTTEPPWRWICSLLIEAPLGTFVGTGWLAGPRTVITAGHNVHDAARMGGRATRIHVFPGRDGSETPFGSVIATQFRTVEPWERQRDIEYDYGAILLPAPIGEQLGYFGAKVFPDEKLRGMAINVAGYPRQHLHEQWFAQHRIRDLTKTRLFYEADTGPGQSGAPVWTYVKDRHGEDFAQVLGIHAYGVEETPVGFAPANSATRLTAPVMHNIQSWIG